jgi:arabinogalactan endo-1,4-beta-galactosidase
MTEMEAADKNFYNKSDVQKDLLAVLKEQGMDSIRLRVWVSPADGTYNNMTDVLAKAKRVKAAGMKLMIDFHYSDYWADPGKQTKPVAWASYTVDQLVTAVADHTRNSLIVLRDAGISPEWVQVGNETSDGMLWDEGRASTNMKNYARFVTSGYDAVKEIFPNALVIVHLDNCYDNVLYQWNIGGLKDNGGKFDVIGASAYPTYRSGSTWQVTNTQCLANLNDMVDRYNVPVMIAEVGAPWDHADAKAIVADIIAKVRSVKNNQGLGVFYWEPEAYGNWKGYSLGAFDNSGKPASAMDAFLE